MGPGVDHDFRLPVYRGRQLPHCWILIGCEQVAMAFAGPSLRHRVMSRAVSYVALGGFQSGLVSGVLRLPGGTAPLGRFLAGI